MNEENEKEKDVILQQREELEDQGLSFYGEPSKINTRKPCCSKKYLSWSIVLIVVCSFFVYFFNKNDDEKVFSSGNIRIEAKLSYTEGIEGDVNVDLAISANDGEVILKEKTVVEVIFSSDKYDITNVPIIFYQDVMITKNKRIPYTFHINKTDFVKSTRMRIRITSLSFDDTVMLR